MRPVRETNAKARGRKRRERGEQGPGKLGHAREAICRFLTTVFSLQDILVFLASLKDAYENSHSEATHRGSKLFAGGTWATKLTCSSVWGNNNPFVLRGCEMKDPENQAGLVASVRPFLCNKLYFCGPVTGHTAEEEAGVEVPECRAGGGGLRARACASLPVRAHTHMRNCLRQLKLLPLCDFERHRWCAVGCRVTCHCPGTLMLRNKHRGPHIL